MIVYKSPETSKRVCLEEFGSFLDILHDGKNIVICGDLNLSLDDKTNNYVKEFLELLESLNLENDVNKQTSLQNHTIDRVGPEYDLSPTHKLIVFNINIWKTNTMKKMITYENKNHFNAVEFIEKKYKTFE